MARATKHILSGSTNGKAILVSATGSPGTLIHTADSSLLDEVWLFVLNGDTVERKLTIEMDTAINVEITIPAEAGLITVLPGLVYTGGVVIRAFGAAANVLLISGFVNRIEN